MNNNDIVNKFIVDETQYTSEKVQKYAEKALKYARITKDGKILFENNNIASIDKLRISLAVRFIGHSFDHNIPDTLSANEAKSILSHESDDAIRARMSQLMKEGFAKKEGPGVLRIYPHKIETLFDNIGTTPSKSPNRKTGGTVKLLSGVGKDVQDLVSAKFFDTPKTVQEVKAKLEQEVKFHDIRVLDTTIRKTFVGNKKILKRIPNEGDGKAKWKYVVR
jgi:hypothetical protein